jgi:alpha-tubulin suppressor-like RCC1 family protein
MGFRAALAAVTLVGCSFEHGTAPGTRDGSIDASDALPPDASPCTAVAIEAGGDHTCAIAGDGSLYCWGRGDEGQLGIDPFATKCVSNTVYCLKTPTKVTIAPVVSVGLGAATSCAGTGTQSYCWGRNATGQYGNGDVIAVTRPLAVAQRAGATAFDGGTSHACSLAGSEFACSGANAEGQIGNMSVLQTLTPITVKTDVRSFALGNDTSCAIDTANQLFCWGRNVYQTIDTSGMIKTYPTLISGVTDVRGVAVGADHVCAALGDGTARCWGLNSSGQIGNGETNPTSEPQPITTVAVSDVAEVAAGRNHTCVRTRASGNVYCFGEGYGAAPVTITTGAVVLAAGNMHDCAVFADGTVRCWGDQLYGQLGNGVDSTARTTTPQLAKLCP